MSGRTVADKNELLFRHGINFNDLPLWQRRGTGLSWEGFEHRGRNPVSGKEVITTRRRARMDEELPTGDGYTALLAGLMACRGEAGPLAPGGD